MKTLFLVTAGLMTCTAAGFAAPGGGTGPAAGTAAAAGGGGGHAVSAAPAAHVSSGFAGVNHAASANLGGPFRPGNPGASGAGSFSGGGARMGSRPPGFAGASQGATMRTLPATPTVHNAWSDPVNPRVAGGPSANPMRYAPANNARPGQTLDPGAYGYAPADRPANGNSHHGHAGYDGFRGHHRYFYNNFPYPVYYPYAYGGIGYGGVVGDHAGLTADPNVADLGAPDFSTTPNNYYSYVAPPQDAPNAGQTPAAAGPSSPPLPDAPAVGPQNPSADAAKSSDNAQQGPDSLVEAVQDELGKRGYFAGKSDAIYGAATREAIRRFQTDQGLPATGRINEATLHALHLD